MVVLLLTVAIWVVALALAALVVLGVAIIVRNARGQKKAERFRPGRVGGSRSRSRPLRPGSGWLPRATVRAVYERNRSRHGGTLVCYLCDGIVRQSRKTETVPPKLRANIEHIVPKSARGSNDLSNLDIACERCNLVKGPSVLPVSKVRAAMLAWEAWHSLDGWFDFMTEDLYRFEELARHRTARRLPHELRTVDWSRRTRPIR